MTFRDDHDAALARAAALERELKRERQATEATAERLAQAQRENVRLEAEIDRRSGSEAGGERPDLIGILAKSRSLGVVLFLIVVGGAALTTPLASWRGHHGDDAPPVAWARTLRAELPCRLDTVPTGATIYAPAREPSAPMIRLGTTPMKLSLEDWIRRVDAYGSLFEARLDGYTPIAVSLPIAGTRCSDAVYPFGAPE